MKKRLFTMILATSAVLPMTSHADVSVEPAGMKIVWKSLKDEFDGFRTYNSKEGVYVSLAISAGEKGIISFDKDKSKIATSDGTSDLGGKFGFNPKPSKDGKTMRIEVVSEKLPAAGADKLKLEGSLEVVVASKTEAKSSKVRTFKKGDMVELSDEFKFEIDSIGKPKWGDAALAVTFKWKRKVSELAAVRFYDADGKEIESSKGSSSWMGSAGNYTVTKSYNLKKKSDQLRIEMDLWIDAEKVTVPVNMALTVGGAK